MIEEQINGTLMWYYYICKREVWLIGHAIEPEQNNDFIALGRHIHDIFYQRDKKEILIDGIIKIDVMRQGTIIGEIKKSSKYLESARMQLAFYLYYLKREKGVILKGKLLIPQEREKIDIELTPELESEIEKAIEGINSILALPKPPKPVRIPYCRHCGYREMCWV